MSLSVIARSAHDGLMANVNAVEVSDCQRAAAKGARQLAQLLERYWLGIAGF